MPGVAVATLQGWVIPLLGVPYGEHTYVTSSCGLVWPCWGRHANGLPLAAGNGSSIVADCLSRPNSQAGIRYGLTGVCHQTSNRILHPAQVTVWGTQGYALSLMAFGVYGRGLWPALLSCYPAGTALAGGSMPATPAPQSGSRNLSSMVDIYDPAASPVVIAQEGFNVANEDMAEFLRLVETALAGKVDKITLEELAAVQANLQHTQAQITRWFDAGEVTAEQYLDLLNTALKNAMDQSRILLGPERFTAVFGLAGDNPQTLVYRATFLEYTATQRKVG